MKEVIAVDLDDVVVGSARPIIDNYNATYGTSLTLDDFYSRDLSNWGVTDRETKGIRVNQYLADGDFFENVPFEESSMVISGLKKASYDLVIVTGRPEFTRDTTERWLDKHLPGAFEELVFTNYFADENVRSKGEICRDLGVSMLIDDHIDHVLSAAEVEIESLLFGNYPWNHTDEVLPRGISRVANWQAVAEHFNV